jgi:hypothetical protein
MFLVFTCHKHGYDKDFSCYDSLHNKNNLCMCITPFNTYTTLEKMKYFIYVLQAR